MKKKLQQFLVEMFKMGTVRGFQHFSMYLRGKEEMGLTVYHEPQVVKDFFFSVSINLFPGYLYSVEKSCIQESGIGERNYLSIIITQAPVDFLPF